MPDPIFIDHNEHRTWLKWHRARRRLSDPVFTGARIREGMRLGASIEIDLMVHQDHGMVVLHGPRLEGETTGTGLPRETGAAALQKLFLRANDGSPTDEPVMLLEDLVAELQASTIHADALLQLDFKEDMKALDPATISNFARTLAPIQQHFILSAGDATAVAALAAELPRLQIGYDPCDSDSLAKVTQTQDFDSFVANALAASPDAKMIYLGQKLVLFALDHGYDLVAAFHAAGRRIDAYTIRTVDEGSLKMIEQLLALEVDQITTDDPEGLWQALR